MLTAAIYDKMLSLPYGVLAESAAVTLMSTDLSGIERFVPLFHDMWAAVIELGFGMAILGSMFGASCVLLIIPSICKYTFHVGAFCYFLYTNTLLILFSNDGWVFSYYQKDGCCSNRME